MSEKYDEYLKDHIDGVSKSVNWLIENDIVNENCVDLLKDFLAVNHDSSKYSPIEYFAYDDYFYKDRNDSDIKEAFDYAWLHHIHNNPHHWQYWVLINDEDGTKALEMPEEYVYEMIADWWSFSWKSEDYYEIFDWYDKHKENMILHSKTKKLVEDILDKIRNKLDSEDDTHEKHDS